MSAEYCLRSRNALLVKDDVGKAKPSIYDLPGEGHAFGLTQPPDAEGAREVVGSWAAHVPRARPGHGAQDFAKLNVLAAQSSVVTAGQVRAFRRENCVTLGASASAGALPKVIPSDVIPTFSYGRKSRPSTPIKAVVSCDYATEQQEVLALQYRQLADRRGKDAPRTAVKLTEMVKKQMHLARSARKLLEADLPPAEPFKLSKFKKVGSRLNVPSLRRSASVPKV